VLNGGVAEMQDLERKIEAYLGIENVIVSKEYGADEKLLNKPIVQQEVIIKPRLKSKKTDILNLTLFDLSQGDILDWQGTTWKIEREVQYDWENSESHRQFQISNKQTSHMFYVSKKANELLTFQEETINLVSTFPDLEQQLQENLPPSSLSYQNETYWREYALRGNKFLISEPNNPFFPVKVWIYLNQDRTKMLRIENFDNFDFKLLHGSLEPKTNFENLLSVSDV
jgi:hypothetical protein